MARKSRKHPDSKPNAAGMKSYRTAIYARLSREALKTENIEAQIEEVQSFLSKKSEFEVVKIYRDNGYSGTNFHRPAFEQLMENVRNREIDCIVVKDLSRFAREHIGGEDYLNNIFPFLGVRFIAVNDGYDNIRIEPQEYFLASFKLLAHSYFAQETSRKVSMTKQHLQEQGIYVGSKLPYGYIRDPEDKHKLIPHPEESKIVYRIFEMAANDLTPAQICRVLNQEQPDGYHWTVSRVWQLLKSERYKGVLVQRFSVTALYKNEEMRRTAEGERIRIEDAIPSIVPAALWEQANRALVERHDRREAERPENPYKGLVCCVYCGRNISCGFRRDLKDFAFCCNKCRKGVFTKGAYLDQAVLAYLELPEDAAVTSELLHKHFSRILVRTKHEIIFEKKEGSDA